MIIARSNIHRPMVRVNNELNRLFGDFFQGSLEAQSAACSCGSGVLNVWEDEGAFHAEVEVPGYSMDQIEVSVLDNLLTISGERSVEGQDEERTYHHRERTSDSFERKVRLSKEIDAAKVSATLRDGVLTVELPKAQAALPHKIEVTS